MRFSRRFPAVSLFSLIVFGCAAGALLSTRPAVASGASLVAASEGLGLEKEQEKAAALVEVLPVQEALGPLAPIALSPFFALTCLSGASLVADWGILPERFSDNVLIGSESPLGNGAVFAGLLALTLITAVPKLTKVTKPFAQAVDQIENYSGIIAVLAVQALSQVDIGGGEPERIPVVYQAGAFTFGYTTLLMVFSAMNLFVINTVKFFFEVLVLLSPIPAVDALFEAANKAFVAFLMTVYLFNAWLATVLNLIILLFCLIIFAWVWRRVTYMRSVLGDPLFGWIAEAVFRRPPPTPASTPLPGRLSQRFPDATLVLKAFAARRREGVKRKMRGFLIQSGGRLFFAASRLLRSPIVVALPSEGHIVKIDAGLLSTTISIENEAGKTAMSVLLTRRYNPILNDIRKQVSGVFAGDGPAGVPSGALAVGRSVGAAVRGGGSEALRGNLT